MTVFVTVIHVVVCVFLILVILLQAGKGGSGLGFGMAGSQTVFGARGSQTFLGKVTTICAAIFFTTCIVLSFAASHSSLAARVGMGADGGTVIGDGGTAATQLPAPLGPATTTTTTTSPAPAPEGASPQQPPEQTPEQPKP